MRAGECVMASVTRFLEAKLKLKVNRAKSAVAPVGERKFLGYRITEEARLHVAPASLVRLRAALKAISSRRRGISLERMIEQINARAGGWVRYFALAERADVFKGLDRWLRRRLRCMRLKQCKRAVGIVRFLRTRGLPNMAAWTLALSGKGWWRLANTPQASRAMPIRWFDELGLLSLAVQHAALLHFAETAGYAEYVRWCGRTAGVTQPPTRFPDRYEHLVRYVGWYSNRARHHNPRVGF
jgi:RNA-directed DNA polymerase